MSTNNAIATANLLDLAIAGHEHGNGGLSCDGLRDAFIGMFRRVPGAVAIIATAFDGERRGMAATAWCSLCADPPCVLVCVNQNASPHGFIEKSAKFSINQLSSDHQDAVAIFSNQRGLDGEDRFVEGLWDESGDGVPFLRDAVVSLGCNVIGQINCGTHSIFVGQVKEVSPASEIGSPAIFFEGKVRGVVADTDG